MWISLCAEFFVCLFVEVPEQDAVIQSVSIAPDGNAIAIVNNKVSCFLQISLFPVYVCLASKLLLSVFQRARIT
jgi:hypothetical protein